MEGLRGKTLRWRCRSCERCRAPRRPSSSIVSGHKFVLSHLTTPLRGLSFVTTLNSMYDGLLEGNQPGTKPFNGYKPALGCPSMHISCDPQDYLTFARRRRARARRSERRGARSSHRAAGERGPRDGICDCVVWHTSQGAESSQSPSRALGSRMLRRRAGRIDRATPKLLLVGVSAQQRKRLPRGLESRTGSFLRTRNTLFHSTSLGQILATRGAGVGTTWCATGISCPQSPVTTVLRT